jgi:hypothetical protein
MKLPSSDQVLLCWPFWHSRDRPVRPERSNIWFLLWPSISDARHAYPPFVAPQNFVFVQKLVVPSHHLPSLLAEPPRTTYAGIKDVLGTVPQERITSP